MCSSDLIVKRLGDPASRVRSMRIGLRKRQKPCPAHCFGERRTGPVDNGSNAKAVYGFVYGFFAGGGGWGWEKGVVGERGGIGGGPIILKKKRTGEDATGRAGSSR